MRHLNPRQKGNPILEITATEVLNWIDQQIRTTEFADRALMAVQLNVQQPFRGGDRYHMETPSFTVMVSNIPGTRVQAKCLSDPSVRFREGPNGEQIRVPVNGTGWGRIDYLTEGRAWPSPVEEALRRVEERTRSQ